MLTLEQYREKVKELDGRGEFRRDSLDGFTSNDEVHADILWVMVEALPPGL